ncbi:50S ribosomal protein L31 [Candidatus Parcubacteria bacterium]|nr:50S ribosomal protein L31 [Candidatus Parcubacteria bacterium]
MKKDIHPKYYSKATAKCACGNTFDIGSTKEFIETEVCSQCHPFYTGKTKIMDTMGRVDKFKKRLEKKQGVKAKKTREKSKK